MDPLNVEGRPLLAELKKAAEAVHDIREEAPPPTPPAQPELDRAIASDIGQGAILFDRDGYIAWVS